MNNNEWFIFPPGPCPTADGIPCGFNASNCYLPEQACNGVNDCSNPLAFDEIPDFVEMSGGICPRRGNDSGSGSGIGLDQCKYYYASSIPLNFFLIISSQSFIFAFCCFLKNFAKVCELFKIGLNFNL